MKKILTTLLSLAILLTAIPLTLTSCSGATILNGMKGDAQAMYFFYQVNKKAGKADSKKVEQTLYMKVDLDNTDYEQTTTATMTTIGKGKNMTALTQVVSHSIVNKSNTYTYNDYGYADGMMFQYNRELGAESKIKSPISVREYERFVAEQNQDGGEIIVGNGYSETMTCVQNEDKTWTATYEGFTEAGMVAFYKMLAGVEQMVTADHALADVRMTVNADRELYLSSISIEYLFEKNPEADTAVPEVRIDYKYEGWNNTVLAEPYDLSEFTEVEDVRYVERFLNALRDRETAESGSFEVRTTANVQYGKQAENTDNTQTVTFDSGDGYAFTVKTTRSNYDYTSAYRNGELTSEVRNHTSGNLVESTTERIRDYEAQSLVQQMMNSENIRGVDIVGAELTDRRDGVYRFTLGESVRKNLNSQYKSMYGSNIDTFNGYIDATVADGVLKSYVYNVDATLKINNETLTISIRMTVTFDTAASNLETV